VRPSHTIGRTRDTVGLALALLASLAMLVVFGAVVQSAVSEGEARRTAAASRAHATWRCQALHGPLSRDACLANIASRAVLLPSSAP
jgi:putative exporter of polyketide antibiotics